ncbi:MAG: oligosaccharide flippase family protein [Actinomycetota bacterium]
MRQHLVRLGKQSLVYGLSGATLQAIGIVTFPILARVFHPHDYGVLEIGTAATAVAITLVDVGMGSASQRSFYDYPKEAQDERRVVISTGLAFTTAVATIVAAVAVLARHPISAWLFNGENHTRVIALAALTIPVSNGAAFLRNTMRLRFRTWQFAVSSSVTSLVSAGVILLCVVALDLGVEGVFVGLLVGQSLACCWGLVVVREDLGLRLSRSELRSMLAFGAPLVVTAISMWALMLVDRIMLGKLSTLGEVGQYAAANRVAAVLLLVTAAFASAYGPYAFSIYSEDPELEKLLRARTLTYLAGVLSLVALALTLFARNVLELVAPSYDTAYEGVGLVALGGLALGLSTVVMSGISFARRTHWFAVLSLAAAAVNVGLNVVLIPPLGMVGAAFATAVAFAGLTAAYYAVSQRVYPTPYRPWRALTVVVAAAAVAPLGLLRLGSLSLDLALKAGGLVAFVLLLALAGLIEPGDLSRLRGVLTFREAQA